MSIRYFLRPNKLPTNPDAYVAHVKPWGTLMEEDIINRMQRQGSTITREDALAAVYLYQKTILDALGEGYNVVTDTVNYSASIRGSFPGADVSFNRSRHTIQAVVRPGKRLRFALREAAVTRIEPASRLPLPQTLYDAGSETVNHYLTPGSMARLNGRRLKYDPTDELQGIFFLDETRRETAVTQTAKLSPSELIFIVPPMPPGTYTLIVRNIPQQELLQGQLDQRLTIA